MRMMCTTRGPNHNHIKIFYVAEDILWSGAIDLILQKVTFLLVVHVKRLHY